MSTFWACVIALTTLLYVVLDGFDLGVGILFGTTRSEGNKRRMLSAISPVWDGNETWLVITGTVLFGAFPVVYASLLSAFYVPVILMLGGLILRGVSFEFRFKATHSRPFWDGAFYLGSLLASFMQGVIVGALVQGIPMEGRHFSGGTFYWFNPFALLCGFALCVGYALLGACWLIGKDEGVLRDRLYGTIRRYVIVIAILVALIFLQSLRTHLGILNRWVDRPYLFIFPAMGFIGAGMLIRGALKRTDYLMFPMATVVFISAYAALAASFWPYMIPFAITIAAAAAPPSSLSFMFWGTGLFALPITLLYTASVYRIFRGRAKDSESNY